MNYFFNPLVLPVYPFCSFCEQLQVFQQQSY